MSNEIFLALRFWQEEGNWFWRFWVGETYGIDWLYLLGGTLFIGAVGYGIYAGLLYNLVASNWHPANFRKLIWALCFMLWIVWFEYVFAHVFGGYMLILLGVVWLASFIVFLATRRKVGPA